MKNRPRPNPRAGGAPLIGRATDRSVAFGAPQSRDLNIDWLYAYDPACVAGFGPMASREHVPRLRALPDVKMLIQMHDAS
jgi:hypothetical protein